MKKLKTFLSLLTAALLLVSCFVPAAFAADGEECRHVFVFTEKVAPSGCKDGYGVYKCSRCDYEKPERVIIPGNGNHTWAQPVETASGPYACQPGSGTHTCTVCGRVENCETAPQRDHDWVLVMNTYPDRCIPGVERYECSICKTTKETERVSGTDHSWEWVIDTPPTEYSTGTKHQVCSVCGAVRNQNTPIPSDKSVGGFGAAILSWIDTVGNFFKNIILQIRDLFGGFQF